MTRWARNSEIGEIETNPKTGKKVLEFVAIKRKNSGEWAIPGGKKVILVQICFLMVLMNFQNNFKFTQDYLNENLN